MSTMLIPTLPHEPVRLPELPPLVPSSPSSPEVAQGNAPMIYVHKSASWEYKQLTRNLAKEDAPTAAELNALGKEGWELAGVTTDAPFVYFYFKRLYCGCDENRRFPQVVSQDVNSGFHTEQSITA